MKKLIVLIIATVCLMSCRGEYNEIDYKKSDGLILKIDSAKYEKALIYDRGKELVVVTKEGIKEVPIWDAGDCVLVGMVIGAIIATTVSILHEL